MKVLVAVIAVIASACGIAEPSPSAQEKYDEFVGPASQVSTGTQFIDLAQSLGHECIRKPCAGSCQIDSTDLSTAPDEIAVCRWDEELSGYSDVVFGTVFSVFILASDQVESRKIEIIYTGP